MATSTGRGQLQAELIQKALKDNTFRQNLIKDPKGTLEKEYGVKLPPDLKVQVHSENLRSLHIVLPSAPKAGTALSTNEMDTADCSGWSSFASCTLECTQCGNNGTTCAPGPTEE